MEILGIDIGGSGIKGAIVDIENGKLLSERYRIPTPNPSTPAAVAECIRLINDHFNWKDQIGCGFPAVIHGGKVLTASNIDEGWIGVNVVELIQNVTNCETHVVNDADAAGLAEMQFGSGRNHNGVVMIITVGTGLGTALFTQRILLPNTEFGQVLLNGQIAERYAADGVRKKLDLSWKKWAKRFNQYLAEIERLLWPDLIIIGGGVSKKHDKFFHYLKCSIEIIPAQLRNEAGIIGAALSIRL
jgi:polyphosphate glucokinase